MGGRPRRAARVAGVGETVFATYSGLARELGAINLGQGFPDDPPDAAVVEALRAAASGPQQYAPLPGDGRLRAAIARAVGAALGRELDPQDEVLVTVGATEGIFAAVQGLVDPGDEVVLVEPFYDAYPHVVRMAGATPVAVPMRRVGERWGLDREALAAAVTPRTRLLVVNTPHNPTGAVYAEADLDAIVGAAASVDALIVCDEVYEHLAFVPFPRIAARPGAWARTLSVSSVGKSFGVTGWKIGWVTGPAELVAAVRAAHQWIPFVVATPLQRASASLVEAATATGGAPYARLRQRLRDRRDRLVEGLRTCGFATNLPDAGYFVLADARPLGEDDGEALARRLPHEAGVVAIPMGSFVRDASDDAYRSLLRFAFCKGDDALAEAERRLRAWRGAARDPVSPA